MYVKLMYVKFLYVKFVCDCCMCKEAGGGGEGARDTESKTRTPHKDVGKNNTHQCFWSIATAQNS